MPATNSVTLFMVGSVSSPDLDDSWAFQVLQALSTKIFLASPGLPGLDKFLPLLASGTSP